MGRRPGPVLQQQQDDVVSHRQVEEFVSNATRRVPGLRTLKIEVAEDGTVSFEYEVFRIIGGKGKV